MTDSKDKDNLQELVQKSPPTPPNRQVIREEQYSETIWHRLEQIQSGEEEPVWYRYVLDGEGWDIFYVGSKEPLYLKPPSYEELIKTLVSYQFFVNDDVESISQQEFCELRDLEYLIGSQKDKDYKVGELRASLKKYLSDVFEWSNKRTEQTHERLSRKMLLGVITSDEEVTLRRINNYLAEQSH